MALPRGSSTQVSGLIVEIDRQSDRQRKRREHRAILLVETGGPYRLSMKMIDSLQGLSWVAVKPARAVRGIFLVTFERLNARKLCFTRF